MSGAVLALPDPRDIPLAEVRTMLPLRAAAARKAIREAGGLPEADNLRRQLEALRRFIDDQATASLLMAESRRTEILIGDFLGPAVEGRPAEGDKTSFHNEVLRLNHQQRYEFRLLYDFREQVEQWLEQGTVDRPTLLLWIKKFLARTAAATTKADGASAVLEAERYRLYAGDCFSFDAEFSSAPADFIITDAPYKADADAVGLCQRLAQHAPRWVRDDGSVLLMIGQMYLPEVVRVMAPHLHYRWTLAYLTPGGQAVQIWPHQVNTFWKPVIWFSNFSGKYRDGWRGDATNGEVEWLADIAQSGANESKRSHEWGQSESGMEDLMRRFVSPGATVLDPFMGGGTTGVVALRLGCRFVGVDIRPENVQIAAERLARE